jgi:amino acid adenylation domain-containing protein/thioester reductase-like protein
MSTVNVIHKFSCYLIGEDSVAASCAQTILECGYNLLGICSPSSQLRNFANQYDIPYTDSLEVLKSWSHQSRGDFLFSIVNSHILKDDVIKLPRYFAINYHNSPLPKLAGVHATSWAILDNEQHHGVTWHILTKEIDAGDILKQAIFKIDPQDTNFTLDVKCIEHALPLFRELLEELATGKYKNKIITQDLSQRSYHSLYQKPKHWGIISWTSTANEIYAIYRALDFSGYDNKLCLPKFVLDDSVFIIKNMDISPKSKATSPGTVVEISSTCMRVATATDDVVISQLADINGKDYTAAKFSRSHGVKVDDVLRSLGKNFLSELALYCEQLAKSESFWVEAFSQIKGLNFLALEQNTTNKNNTIKKLIYQDKTFRNKAKALLLENIEAANALATILFLYLYRLNNYENFSVGYEHKDSLIRKYNAVSDFFAKVVPINLNLAPDMDFHTALFAVNGSIQLADKHKTFAKDLTLRYARLAELSTSLTVVFSFLEHNESIPKNCLYFVINNEEINLYLPDNLDAVDQEIINNMSGHLQVFINDILSDKDLSVSKAALLTKQEEQLIKEWNNTTTVYPREASVPAIFEQEADKYPDNIAVKFNEIILTYRELNQKANQLAHYLTTLGVRNGSLVATYFDRGSNAILGILSILKTGAAYVPIDPTYPRPHIEYMLKDTGTVVILTQEENRNALQQHLPFDRFLLISIDDAKSNETIFTGKNTNNLALPISATDSAYIMYTSGSTGIPKGIMVNHRGIIRLVKNTNYIQFTANDNIAQAANMSFDAATFEIWGALLNGAKLVCTSHSTILDVDKFDDFLHKEKIDILLLTAALFDKHATIRPSIFKELKYLLVGGDVLNVEATQAVINCQEGAPQYLLNCYGPTENACITTTFKVSKNFDRNKPIPIGGPIANTTTYVLDKHANLLPVGIPGELHTGGDGLALGYWKQDQTTKEKFVTLLVAEKNQRLYKVGDLARWLPSGDVDFLGRIDNQVKIRGVRIELNGIESHLLNSNLVSQCAVVIKQDKNQHKIIVAYLVAKNKGDFDLATLRNFLSQNLPAFMVPNIFIVMDKLPLNPNGKVDKAVLPFDPNVHIISHKRHIAPRTELENKLFVIWKELFNLDNIGINDDFFYLGGHSLLVTEMILKVRKVLNVDFSLPTFLQTPTIVNLAKLIAKQQNKNVISEDSLASVPNFITDIELDQKIQPLAGAIPDKLQAVLLTGATGFLGAFLLDSLYRSSAAKIYCLVRGSDYDNAKQRLASALKGYKLDETIINQENIEIIVGDLAKSLLGLDPQIFDKLSEEVDYIYHCGAQVHHLYNYDVLRAANVLSTIEILKLATTRKNKHIHYISTLAAATDYTDARNFIIEDFLTADKLPSLSNVRGYTQTKLASEIILSEAHKRGIPVTIYRPTWITGHTSTGACSLENNHLFLLLKGCIQMGYAPKLNAKLNMVPVDFVSDLITQISLNTKQIKTKVFNIANSKNFKWTKLFGYLCEYGYKTKLISPQTWCHDHLAKVDKNNVIYPLITFYMTDGGINWAKEQNRSARVNIKNTKQASRILGVDNIVISSTILNHYFDFLKASGFLF